MKKLIFKNFIYDLSVFFVTTLLILSVIVWTLQAVNFFDFVTEDGHSLGVYFSYTFLNFPKIIHRILPFVFFISLFYTIIKFEENNELYIFWLNGFSKLKFINSILLFSIILMCIQILVGSYLSPYSQLKARQLLKNSNIDFFTNLINEGKFINAVSGLTIYLEKKNADNFSNIFIDDSTKRNSRMIYAKNGRIISNKKDKKFVLFDGEVINISENKLNLFKFDKIDFDLLSYGTQTIIKPKIQETNSKQLINCFSNKEITKNKANCDLNSLDEVKQELIKRFYKPVYIPLISMLACLILFSSKYSYQYKRYVRYIFLLIFIVIVISEVSLRYSTNSNISLFLYFLTPIFLIFSFYYLLYNKIDHA